MCAASDASTEASKKHSAKCITHCRSAQGYYRAEGCIRNFNTIDEFRAVDKAAFVERSGKTIWDAVNDGTIYSCPSLLCSFSAICFADLKKYKFTYHFAYPCLHSEPQWKLVSPDEKPDSGIGKLDSRETETLVESVQTWRYSVDKRQHGFFLAKRIRRDVLEAQWRSGGGEIEEEKDDDGNLNMGAQRRRKSRTTSLGQMGFLWSIAPLESYETGFFDSAAREDRFVCFADPSTYPTNPGWMLRNLLVLVRQKWKLDEVQILCYRDTHARREHPTSIILNLQSATPVHAKMQSEQSKILPIMSTSTTALRPDEVDINGDLIRRPSPPTDAGTSAPATSPQPTPPKPPPPLPKITGWERNESNKIVSRTVDLAAYMDPAKLADQAVDLNLKLIKWRISPSINLDAIKYTSCLLLGAGTLGSYVARNLMGWGVRRITFVDNGRVSYSNPVRQPLYEFKDCEAGGARKAERAADVLGEIYPGVEADGHNLSVPMAGHPVMDEAKVKRDYEKLKELIEEHDAIFLLMDTRESRWLPTVMAKAAGKVVINAALGFDTYVVMRHGLRVESTSSTTQAALPHVQKGAASNRPKTRRTSSSSSTKRHTTEQPTELGCYFCSDVVAPADSLKSATLDQQCTVTRPGAAPLASALAVELLVSITQHVLGAHAPAPPPPPSTGGSNTIQAAPPTDPSLPGSHPLGTVPHMLRGFMSTWQTLQVSNRAYDCCAACSPTILEKYEIEGWEFVKRAIGEKGYVEEISGLAEVQRRGEEAEREMDAMSWSEDDSGDGEGELL